MEFDGTLADLVELELAGAAEDRFGVPLTGVAGPPAVFARWHTAGDVHRAVVAALGAQLAGWPGGEPAVWEAVRDLIARGYDVPTERVAPQGPLVPEPAAGRQGADPGCGARARAGSAPGGRRPGLTRPFHRPGLQVGCRDLVAA